jgi:hypothetical protein
LQKKRKKNEKKKKEKLAKKKNEKEERKNTVDYCCNPQCFVCGGTVNPPHDLVYLLIFVFGDIIFFFFTF